MSRPVVALGLFLLAAPCFAEEPFRYPEAKHGKGELKYVNGVPVLVVVGTPEEIGEQVGVLALKPIGPKVKELADKLLQDRLGPAWKLLVSACEGLFAKFPAEYRAEVEAMAKAGGVDRELLIVGNTIADLQHLGGCSALVVEPSRSATGELIFGRNFDFPPVGDLPRYGLVIVYRPEGKHAFATVTFPGSLIGGQAMNEKGLTFASNDVREAADGSPPFDAKGTPSAPAGRELMQNCAILADAEKVFKGLRATTTGAVILADPRGSAVYEVTPKNVVARKASDAVCLCTNHFRAKALATSTRCWRFDVLQKCCAKEKFSVQDVAEALHKANQGAWTMQSMVFEPKALRIHVAVGPGPVTKHPLRKLELADLLRGGE